MVRGTTAVMAAAHVADERGMTMVEVAAGWGEEMAQGEHHSRCSPPRCCNLCTQHRRHRHRRCHRSPNLVQRMHRCKLEAGMAVAAGSEAACLVGVVVMVASAAMVGSTVWAVAHEERRHYRTGFPW